LNVGEELDKRRAEEWRPVREAGGGEAEGFEMAEEELVNAASHADPIAVEPFPPEVESDRSGAVYGEPDELDSTEVNRDPSDGQLGSSRPNQPR
jgi:hypothetical protein